ncbi:MAG: class I SAM-dependent methyltransferase [Pseudomonadota bacterium]
MKQQCRHSADPLRSHKPGQWLFSLMSHRLYDFFLYCFVSGFIWRCPPGELSAAYREYSASNHLEIGVGTGYLLHQQSRYRNFERLGLMDLNMACLTKSAQRLVLQKPETMQVDITSVMSTDGACFDSVAMNFVLHCVPGTFIEKRQALKNVHRLLNPGGVFFGATLLATGVRHSKTARILMTILNRLGIFNNNGDALQELEHCLKAEFSQVRTTTLGSAVLWVANK